MVALHPPLQSLKKKKGSEGSNVEKLNCMPAQSSILIKGVKWNSLFNNVKFTVKNYQPCKEAGNPYSVTESDQKWKRW